MKAPRLPPAAAALVALFCVLAAGATYGRRLIESRVHAVAPQMFAQKHLGAALQRAAFRQSDLLPLYGSSDLNVPNRYHPSALFRDYPTGFTVFPVGNAGSSSLHWLQALAAVGSDLRGRKVALSVSARPFLDAMADPHSYAANFSRLHANALAFGGAIDFSVRQRAARRMLQYPATLANDPLLRFGLEKLADGSPLARLFYYASVPLGRLQSAVLRLQDDWESLAFLRAQLGLGPVGRTAAVLDWPALRESSADDSRRRGATNPFGFDPAFWARHAPEIAMQKGAYAAADRVLEDGAEWTDLELLLRAIGDLGGEPLLLAVPINEAYYEHLGVSVTARRRYRERLSELASSHGAELVDFDAAGPGNRFTVDPAPHLSAEGWVLFDRALEGFFHGRGPGAL